MIKNGLGLGAIAAVVGNLSFCFAAIALPGQLTDDVKAWVASNPSFRGSLINELRVTRFNTAAQKFTFNASIYSPTSFKTADRSLVRSETLDFFDVTNGVSFERLSEALRTVYGVNVYQDFAGATLVYSYPDLNTEKRGNLENLPILLAQQGKLYSGDRFAYWVEIIKTGQDSDFANRGQITVLLKEDLPELEGRLSNR